MDYIYNICLPVVRAGVEVVGGEVVLVTGTEILCLPMRDQISKIDLTTFTTKKFILF